jgi:hypothetical protein
MINRHAENSNRLCPVVQDLYSKMTHYTHALDGPLDATSTTGNDFNSSLI